MNFKLHVIFVFVLAALVLTKAAVISENRTTASSSVTLMASWPPTTSFDYYDYETLSETNSQQDENELLKSAGLTTVGTFNDY